MWAAKRAFPGDGAEKDRGGEKKTPLRLRFWEGGGVRNMGRSNRSYDTRLKAVGLRRSSIFAYATSP